MTHRRKRFIVYPSKYDMYSAKWQRLVRRYSKYQALKVAYKMGDGAEIMEFICIVEPQSLMDISGREWVFNKRKSKCLIQHKY